MKKILMLAMVLLSGCAITTNYTIKEPCNFTQQFKTVRLEVKDEVNTPYSKAGVEEFKSILTAHLGKTPVSVGKFGGLKVRQGLGYQVVTENEDLLIKVSIVYFQPDNKALRIIVGWGSGKGGLKYVAEFSSKGKILATSEGGKSYGDVNVFGDTESTIYRGEDSTRSFMIMHSVLDIGDFLRGENRESEQTPQVTEPVVKPMVAIPAPPIVEQRPPKEEGTITSREEAIAKREEAVAKREEAVAKREEMKGTEDLNVKVVVVPQSTGRSSGKDLPKEIAAFSGKWSGKWNNETVFTIEITEIDLKKAEIIYISQETVMFPAVDFSETAKVILGKNPKIQFNKAVRFKGGGVGSIGWFTFEMQKDLKTLKGVAQWPKDTSKATLEKID